VEPHLTIIRRTESHFVSADGRTLFRRAWIPGRVDQVILLVHGLCEHSGRYEGVGRWFAERNTAVHAFDHQGHGRAQGRRGHLRKFRHLIDDLESVLRIVQSEHPGLRVFLVGHSMGGLIVTEFLRRKPSVAGAVTSGAALALPPSIRGVRVFALRVVRRLAPLWKISTGIDTAALSRDPEVGAAYLADPLVLPRMTLGLAAELFRTVRRALNGAAHVEVPMLLLHGEDDPICPLEGSRSFEAQLAPQSELRTYPGLRHEIFNEPEGEAVFEDIAAWLSGQAETNTSLDSPPGGSADVSEPPTNRGGIHV